MADNMTINAGVIKTYGRDFKLDPTMLRNVVKIINEATTKLDRATTINFSVYRENDYFYETISLDEVLKDENASGEAIKNLDIRLVYEGGKSTESEDIALVLKFSRFKDDKILFYLDSKEKEWSYQLANKLEAQIKRILRRPQIPLKHGLIDWLAIAALAAILLVAYNWISNAWTDAPVTVTKETLSSKTLEEKFDTFIIAVMERLKVNKRQYVYVWPLAIVFWGTVFVLIDAKPITRFLEKYSRSAFYWGDAIKAYDDSRRLEFMLFWCVLVALIVTIVGGILVTNMM